MRHNNSNFKVPGRFEKHECTFITWPCKGDKEIDLLREEIINMIRIISKYEKVILIIDPDDYLNAARECENYAEIWTMPTDVSWIRDNGPIFVKNDNNEVAAIHYKFNGWGKKFLPYDKVMNIPSLIAKKLNITCFKSRLIVEGGGVSFDGEGTVITTEQMLMNKNRNSSFTRKEIEKELDLTLGIKKVIWLKNGLVEDWGTDGHVDCIVEYISPGKIFVQTVNNKSNPNYNLLKENFEIIKKVKDARGRSLEVIEMPYLPYFSQKYNGEYYVSPYINYYIVNNAILVPEVDPKIDDAAYKIISNAFPDRDIVPIPSFYQAIGGGGPGCMTQQLPAGSNIGVK